MRNFRDAKTMAHSLRQALTAKAVSVTHSESLELVAKTFGFENWNILAAKIEAERPASPKTVAADDPKTTYCSFCGKSQHVVPLLIAGPDVAICNECVGLCDNIIEDREIDHALAGTPEQDRFAAMVDILRGKVGAALAAYRDNTRQWLDHIEWSLGQSAEALSRLEHGAPWTPDERAISRGWTRDPLAGKSRDEMLAHQAMLERQQNQIRERLAAADEALSMPPGSPVA
jgi:hypothetical protein